MYALVDGVLGGGVRWGTTSGNVYLMFSHTHVQTSMCGHSRMQQSFPKGVTAVGIVRPFQAYDEARSGCTNAYGLGWL